MTAVTFDPSHDAQVRLDARVTTCAGCDGWAWDGALCSACCRKFSGAAALERPSTPLAGPEDFPYIGAIRRDHWDLTTAEAEALAAALAEADAWEASCE